MISCSPLQQDVPLLSVVAVVGGAICFAQALVFVRRFPPVHPVSMNAVGMTTGAAVLLAAALVSDEPIVLRAALRHGRSWPTWLWSARWSCSCFTWSFSAIGRRPGPRTGS